MCILNFKYKKVHIHQEKKNIFTKKKLIMCSILYMYIYIMC